MPDTGLTFNFLRFIFVNQIDCTVAQSAELISDHSFFSFFFKLELSSGLPLHIVVVETPVEDSVRNLKQLDGVDASLKPILYQTQSMEVHRAPDVATNSETNALGLLLARNEVNALLVEQADEHVIRHLLILQLVEVSQESLHDSLKRLAADIFELDLPFEASEHPLVRRDLVSMLLGVGVQQNRIHYFDGAAVLYKDGACYYLVRWL